MPGIASPANVRLTCVSCTGAWSAVTVSVARAARRDTSPPPLMCSSGTLVFDDRRLRRARASRPCSPLPPASESVSVLFGFTRLSARVGTTTCTEVAFAGSVTTDGGSDDVVARRGSARRQVDVESRSALGADAVITNVAGAPSVTIAAFVDWIVSDGRRRRDATSVGAERGEHRRGATTSDARRGRRARRRRTGR